MLWLPPGPRAFPPLHLSCKLSPQHSLFLGCFITTCTPGPHSTAWLKPPHCKSLLHLETKATTSSQTILSDWITTARNYFVLSLKINSSPTCTRGQEGTCPHPTETRWKGAAR